MPIYEYQCESCQKVFEELVRSQSEEVHCAHCGSAKVTRQLSACAIHGPAGEGIGSGGGGHGHSGSSCGGCSGGSCSSCH